MTHYKDLSIATILCIITVTYTYPNGAPISACTNLIPQHGYPPQQSRSPFVILVAKAQYQPNEVIQVMIRGLCGRQFKGFLVEARRADPRSDTTQPIGSFDLTQQTRLQCRNQGITHINNATTRSLMLNWRAPRFGAGHVLIKGTFVEDYRTYWASVNSAIIYDPSSVPLSIQPSSLLTPYIQPCAEDRPQDTTNTTTTSTTTTTSSTTTTTTTTTTAPPVLATTPPTTTTTASTEKPTTRRSIFPTVQPIQTITTARKTTTTTTTEPVTSIWATTEFIPFHDPDHGWINHPDGKNVPGLEEIGVENGDNNVGEITDKGNTINVTSHAIHRIVMRTECGTTHGCFSQCDSKGCEFLVTWKEYGEWVVFEVTATAIEEIKDQWVAVAFSRDTKMGHDSIVECVHVNGQFSAHLSYNDRFINHRLEFSPDVIQFRSASFNNGFISCEFARLKSTTDVNRIFNLEKDFYVILGQGPVADPITGAIGKHLTDPYASAHPVDFQKHEMVEVYKLDQLFIKLHGCLMVVAWMFCASIGIVISRFYKPLWPTTMICGRKVWYTVHRFLMCLVGILVLAAFIIIFLEVQGLSEISLESMKKLHPVVGIIVTFLTVVNITMGMFRPSYDSKHRTAFNWVHWCTGIMDHIIAIVNIVLGVELQKAHVHGYIQYVIFVYAGYQFFIVVLLEIVQCNSRVKERKQQTYMIYERRSTFYSSTRESSEDDTEPPLSFIRKVILRIHVLLITAFTVSVVAIILIE